MLYYNIIHIQHTVNSPVGQRRRVGHGGQGLYIILYDIRLCYATLNDYMTSMNTSLYNIYIYIYTYKSLSLYIYICIYI